MTYLRIILIMLLALTISCSINPNETNVKQIEGYTTDEDFFNTSDYMGIPIVINFWYPSCPPCAKELPSLSKFSTQNKDELITLGIIHDSLLDSKEDYLGMIKKFEITYPNIFDQDGAIGEKYEILGFPTTIFLDKNHMLVKKWTGFLTEEALEEYSKLIMDQE
jgi:thiol-disulfide isomerase/thioredoxin